jgi:hypothetical protein
MAVTARDIWTPTRKPEFSPHYLANFLEQGGARIIHTRESGHVDCYIPRELIDHEEVPVEEAWAQQLAAQMRYVAQREGGTGQQSAINFGLVPGEPLLKISDGFHRDAALTINQERELIGTAKLTDWNSLYDQRIFDAKDHAHVRFSRVVQWIREVWEHSGLQDELTVEQAILLYRFQSDGSKLGLTSDVVEDSNQWVAKKEELWGMAAMTIHAHLKVAEHVDPGLVHSTRIKKKGGVLVAPTMSILKVFSDKLPDNFDLQNLVMAVAKDRNLHTSEIRALAMFVQDAVDLDTANSMIAKIDWDNFSPAYEKTKTNDLRRGHDPRHKGGAVLTKAATEVIGVIDRTQQVLDRGEVVTPEMDHNIAAAEWRVRELKGELGKLSGLLARARKLNTTDESEPDTEEDTAENSSNTNSRVVRLPQQRSHNRTSRRKVEKKVDDEVNGAEPEIEFDPEENPPTEDDDLEGRLSEQAPKEMDYVPTSTSYDQVALAKRRGQMQTTIDELSSRNKEIKDGSLDPSQYITFDEIIATRKLRPAAEVKENAVIRQAAISVIESGGLTDYRSRVILPLRYGRFPDHMRKNPVFARRGNETVKLEVLMELLDAYGQGVDIKTVSQLLGLTPAAVYETEKKFLKALNSKEAKHLMSEIEGQLEAAQEVS